LLPPLRPSLFPYTTLFRSAFGLWVGDPRLRALAASAGLFNFFDGVIFAVYVLYAASVLGVTQVSLGLIFAAGGGGRPAGGAAAAEREGPRTTPPPRPTPLS